MYIITIYAQMKGKLRQMLVDDFTLREINAAKQLLSSANGRKASSRDVIEEFVGRRLRYLLLKKELRDYISGFVDGITRNDKVRGIMLFGSIARGVYRKESDPDILIVVRGKAMDVIEEVEEAIDRVEGSRTALIQSGFYLKIRPLVVAENDLKMFRPINLSIVEDEVILFERQETLTDFPRDVRRSVEWRKEIVEGEVVLRWKIKA